MNGGIAEITNQSKNDVPLILPTTPAGEPEEEAR